ncbi:MAG TPA: hydrogenase maturation nickel metallochaperone HypA [Deltaproteobacteria bacterium]|nr:hydrogenase maturation nickel metallochaperone HypA [Deltaproteobacteria bacterium]
MHELPVMQSVLVVVLRHASLHRVGRVHSIRLRVGLLSDLEPEWMQRYFDHLSAGTVAEGAKLVVEWAPAVFVCLKCSNRFELDHKRFDEVACPSCGERDFRLVSGREYHIVDMEAQ